MVGIKHSDAENFVLSIVISIALLSRDSVFYYFRKDGFSKTLRPFFLGNVSLSERTSFLVPFSFQGPLDFGTCLPWLIVFLTTLCYHSGSINTADGSALVRMGGSTIVCGVKAEIAEPDLENPDEGFLGELLASLLFSLVSPSHVCFSVSILVPNVDLPAMCHPKFKPGPPSDEAQVLSERLFETLTSYVDLTYR